MADEKMFNDVIVMVRKLIETNQMESIVVKHEPGCKIYTINFDYFVVSFSSAFFLISTSKECFAFDSDLFTSDHYIELKDKSNRLIQIREKDARTKNIKNAHTLISDAVGRYVKLL